MEQVADISVEFVDENLPTVEERLASLRPSRQLLEFYRRKVEELEKEHDSLSVKLDSYSKVCEQEVQLERTIRQREKEIADLQKALSDLQVFLLKEREQNLRLFSENDKLRIRELEDRKTMQHLITIAGPAVAECSYFHKQPPNIVVIKEHKPDAKYNTDTASMRKISADTADSGCIADAFEPRQPVQPTLKGVSAKTTKTNFQNFRVENKHSKGPSQERINDDKQILALQTDALRAQLEETVKLGGDQVTQLMEDRRIMLEGKYKNYAYIGICHIITQLEHETLRKREAERSEQIESRLRKTQELLRDTTKEFLEVEQLKITFLTHHLTFFSSLEKLSEKRNEIGSKKRINYCNSLIGHTTEYVSSRYRYIYAGLSLYTPPWNSNIIFCYSFRIYKPILL